jgi:hypothetical protein
VPPSRARRCAPGPRAGRSPACGCPGRSAACEGGRTSACSRRRCPAWALLGVARPAACRAEPGFRPARRSPACGLPDGARLAPLPAWPSLRLPGGAWPAPCWRCPAYALPGGAWLAACCVARPARAGPGLRPAGVARLVPCLAVPGLRSAVLPGLPGRGLACALLVLPGLCPAGRCLACGLLALPGLRCCPACSRAGRAAGTGLGRRCGGVGGAFGSVAMSHEGR